LARWGVQDSGRKPSAVDLFCGAGGLSLGLKNAGFDVRLGVDFDRHALATYAFNLGDRVISADIRALSGRDILQAAGVKELGLLAGGPSCQGFSTHGKRKADDERNFLYKEFLRIVGEIKPSMVLMENVKGLLITREGAFLRDVLRSFERLGYQVTYGTLLAANYGVPQMRERVFFLASRSGAPLTLPHPRYVSRDSLLSCAKGTLLPYVTVGEAISDLPAPSRVSPDIPVPYVGAPTTDYARLMRKGGPDFVYNHLAKKLSPFAAKIVAHIPMGQGVRALPWRLLPQRFKKMRRISNGKLRKDCTTLYFRLSPEKPAYTITCYFTNVSAGAFTHPSEDRAITAREAARLQSFPDWFRFLGAKVPHQIGNAVPPRLAEAVAESLMEHLLRARRRVA
jgi:DNA (cytosine-5)-methyltransferase 1